MAHAMRPKRTEPPSAEGSPWEERVPEERAAVALAETRKAQRALELLRKILGDYKRASPDAIRGAAGKAALEILGEGDPRPRIRRFLEEAREALG